MKIGIITFWWSQDNYGQIMQCYALQAYLRNKGHDVFLIRYNPNLDTVKTPFFKQLIKLLNPIKVIKYILYLIQKRYFDACNRKAILEQKNNPRYFSEFIEDYIKHTDIIYTSYNQLKENPPEADMYIVGSDQVWHQGAYSTNGTHAYFLDFGNENILKASYSASWGILKVETKYKSIINPLINKFDYVSVREKTGIDLCRECGFEGNVNWDPDPTMLLSADEYRKLYRENEIRRPSKKYILFYLLGNQCDFNPDCVYKYAKDNNLEVIYITGNNVLDNKKKFFATIPEWLYLIDNAEYIITNSFHCGVFATIFEKKYGIIKLTGKMSRMNNRIDSLFERFNIDSRYVYTNNLSAMFNEYSIKQGMIKTNFDNFLNNVKN